MCFCDLSSVEYLTVIMEGYSLEKDDGLNLFVM